MNITEYFANPERKYNKENFIHIVEVARVNNDISDSELRLLYRIGRKMGLTDPEIEIMLKSKAKSDYIPPYELAKRFDNLYRVVKIALVDGIIDKDEEHLIRGFAIKSGFSDEEIPFLIELIINGINEKTDEEDLYESYRKSKKF